VYKYSKNYHNLGAKTLTPEYWDPFYLHLMYLALVPLRIQK